MDPSTAFLAESLVTILSGTKESVSLFNEQQQGRTWILIAVDDSRKTTFNPTGLLLLLEIESIPNGCGNFYPHPVHAAHYMLDVSMQCSFKLAWQTVVDHHPDAARRKQFDYRWRLTVMDDSHEAILSHIANPVRKNQLVDEIWHRRRSLVSKFPLIGRSGDVAIAACLRSAVEEIPLDLTRAATGKFDAINERDTNPAIGHILDLPQKGLGIQEAISFSRPVKLNNIRELVLPIGQATGVNSQFPPIFVSDFEGAWNALSEHSATTQQYRKASRKWTREWFVNNCYGNDENPRGCYIRNKLFRQHREQLTSLQIDSLASGQFAKALSESVDDPGRHLVKIVAGKRSGKTAFLAYCQDSINCVQRERIAIRIEHLADLVSDAETFGYLDATASAIVVLMTDEFSEKRAPQHTSVRDWLIRKTENGEIVWLIDEFDNSVKNLERIRSFANSFPFCSIILMIDRDQDMSYGRLLENTQGLKWTTLELQPFDKNAVAQYLKDAGIDNSQSRFSDAKSELEKCGLASCIQNYLDAVVNDFRWLHLQGISEVGSMQIELDKVYVALKAELKNDYDRKQEADLHSTEVAEAANLYSLDTVLPELRETLDAENVRRTYHPEREEAKWSAVNEVLNLADAFRLNRRIVILGGPGSGKTTLGRWIALQMANALSIQLRSKQSIHAMVMASQVDPEPKLMSEEKVDLGPARFPIFLRVAHFASELAKRTDLKLVQFLGMDKDSIKRNDGLSPIERNRIFREMLKAGAAVVILDGLDELTEANRQEVVVEIQEFVKTFAADEQVDQEDAPWLSGGTQVVITSRYVGYGLAPVRANCVHLGIQSMQRPAVERFAHSWTDAVNNHLLNSDKAKFIAEHLIAEIYNDSKPAVRELATNPLLVTVLATVFYAYKRLPDQRAALYDCVVENLLELWLKRKECKDNHLTREELLAALRPLAAEMQENASTNGLIDIDGIGEIIEGPLAHMRNMETTDPRFETLRNALLTTIGDHVGLLAAQGQGNYSFFHRTIQEFLAARQILAVQKSAAQTIINRIDEPLWREPILLAIGLAMIDKMWGPKKREQFLLDVLSADDQNSLIPRSAMLIVSALPDLRNVPDVAVKAITAQLIASYGICMAQPQTTVLKEQIEQTFVRLKNSVQAKVVEEAIVFAIQDHHPNQRDLAGPCATILYRIDWFTTQFVMSLLKARERDQKASNWPIQRSLIASLGQRPIGLPWINPSPKLQTGTIDILLPMRRFLEVHSELVTFVRRDADWLWLLVALFGGLPQVDVLTRYDRLLKQRIQTLKRNSVRNPLDENEQESVCRLAEFSSIQFSPENIVNDLSDAKITQQICDCIAARKSAQSLVPIFEEQWESAMTPVACAESLIALAALGHDVLPAIQSALKSTSRQRVASCVIERFEFLGQYLKEPLVRSSQGILRTVPSNAPETHQHDLLDIAMDLLVTSGTSPLNICNHIPEQCFVNASTPYGRAKINSEYWSLLFSGANQRLDSGTGLINPEEQVSRLHVEELVQSIALCHKAKNQTTTNRLTWPHSILPPRSDSVVEQYLDVLESLANVPPELHFLAGNVLQRCQLIVEEYPDLVCETVALIQQLGNVFRAGFYWLRREYTITNRAIASLQGKDIAKDLLTKIRSLNGRGFENWDQLSNHLFSDIEPSVRDSSEDLLKQCTSTVMPSEKDPIWSSSQVYYSRISQISDQYLRFRADWRCLQLQVFDSVLHIAATRSPREPTSALQAIEESDWLQQLLYEMKSRRLPTATFRLQLPDFEKPHQFVRACEWILGMVPRNYSVISQKMVDSCDQIDNAENRARAQLRLALYFYDKQDSLLEKGLASLREVSEERRAETIKEAISVWQDRKDVLEKLQSIAESISNKWIRNKAIGRVSRMINEYRNHFLSGPITWRFDKVDGSHVSSLYRSRYPTGVLPWGIVFLSSAAREIEALSPSSSQATALSLLIEGFGKEFDSMEGVENGIQLTPRSLAVLDRKVQQEDLTSLYELLPYLECRSPEAQATTNRWLNRDDLAGRWSALVQAESGLLTPEVAAKVIELMTSSMDRLYMRAALSIHGPNPDACNRRRRWSIDNVGVDTLATIASHAISPNCRPAIRTSLDWVQHDIHCENPDAVKTWSAQIVANSVDSPSANWILRKLESVSDDCIPVLLESLCVDSLDLRRSTLGALARIAYCTSTLKDSTSDLCASLSKVPKDVRYGERVLKNGPVSLLEIADMLSVHRDEFDPLLRIKRLLEPELLWLDSECLSSRALTIQRLHEIGKQCYIQIDSYWSNADSKSAEIKDPADAIELLLKWLEFERHTSSRVEIISHLLTAIESLAKKSVYAFTKIAHPEIWEPILAYYAKNHFHWTARMAAVRLLGRLRRVTDGVVMALQSAMNDVAYVQNAAYEAACEFRRVDSDILPKLLQLLDDPSAGVVAATSRLLTGIARSKCEPSDRRRILQCLQKKVAKSDVAVPVYLMKETAGEMHIQYVERLDRILYQAIFEITGM